MTLNNNNLETALRVLGQLLEDRREHYEIVAIGGGGLLLLGLVERIPKQAEELAFRLCQFFSLFGYKSG